MTDDRTLPVGRTGLALGLGGVCGIAALAFGVLTVTGDPASTLLFVTMFVPALAVLGPLCYIGSKVASKADDPDEVEARLAESLDLSPAEFERRREGRGRHAHPAERQFEVEGPEESSGEPPESR